MEHLKGAGLEGVIDKYALRPECVRRWCEGDVFTCDRQRVFESLSRAIVFQQLAGAAASTIYSRFQKAFAGEEPTPEKLLEIGESIKEVGLSRQKAKYLLDLSAAMQDGRIEAERIPELSEEELQAMLTKVKGIGAWTVEMFQMFTLKRQDVLPAGDLGVKKGVQALFKLSKLPDPKKLEELTLKWRPYRTLGCYFMYRVAEDAKPAKKGSKRKKAVTDLDLPDPKTTSTPPRKKKKKAADDAEEGVENETPPPRRRRKRI